MDLTNYKHFIKLFLLVKTTFSMMEHTLLNISTNSQKCYNISWSSRHNLRMGI